MYDQSPKRCALEMALVAAGSQYGWTQAFLVWPWLDVKPNKWWLMDIAVTFDCFLVPDERSSELPEALRGKPFSLETFIDWVRSIEPADQPETLDSDQGDPGDENDCRAVVGDGKVGRNG